MNRNFTGAARFAAAAGALAIAAFGLGAPGIAHPHGDEDDAVTKTERVIILREGEGKHAGEGKKVRRFRIVGDGPAGADGEGRRIRTFHIDRDGKAGKGERHVRVMRFDGGELADCGGEEVVRSETGDDKDKTKVIICSKDQLTEAQRIEKIEKVLTRIQANDDLSAEHKDRVTAALRRAIEDMRTTP